MSTFQANLLSIKSMFNSIRLLSIMLAASLINFETFAAVHSLGDTKWSLSFSNNPTGDLLNVCLYRDKSTAGFFSLGDKKTRIGFDVVPCEERLVADIDKRIIYFNFDPGTTKPEDREIYCGSMQLTNDPDRGRYSPCTSRFFYAPADSSRSSYRVLPLVNFIETITVEYASIEILEQEFDKHEKMKLLIKLEKEKQRIYDERVIYEEKYKSITTLDEIYLFESQYNNSDYANLIPKLATLKHQLEIKKYNNQFQNAKSPNEIQSFIAEYETKDFDGLIPEAKKRLVVALKNEKLEQVRLDRERIAKLKSEEIEKFANQIINCNRLMEQAYRAIEREHEIGRISGYENKQVLRDAGEMIVGCRRIVTQAYENYRNRGGTKNLSQIK